MKRIFDCVVAILGLIILAPSFFIIGILIKLNDKGPIFFKHKRVGVEGKLFYMYKFRSMRIKPLSEEGFWDPGNITRITPIGKFLRKTKIDELPQLINVLKGEMSLVGPRPEVEKWVTYYPERWETVLHVKPGITDNASIVYRNEESILNRSENPEKIYKEIILPLKLDLYEHYVLNNSFYGDIKLIIKTIYYILFNKTIKDTG
jgi:lipopolysaccharide/colanic/teichoic acid biosynthesis glycosyltransferase